MKCHYIPRLLLRKFAENDRVNLYNLPEKQMLNKKIRDCFTEDDLFSEELEQKFNKNLESVFGSILNNKLLSENEVRLEFKDAMMIGYFFIFHAIRALYADDFESMLERGKSRVREEVAKYRSQFSEEVRDEYTEFLTFMFCGLMPNEDTYELLLSEFTDYVSNNNSMSLPRSQVLRLLILNDASRYYVIWDSSKCGEEFILPKMTQVNYRDIHGSHYKFQYLSNFVNDRLRFEKLSKKQQSRMLEVLDSSSIVAGDNYVIYPLSPTRLLVAIHDYFSLFFPRRGYGMRYPYVPKVLREKQFYEHFFSEDDYKPRFELFEPCLIKNESLVFPVKDLTEREVYILNALSLNEESEAFIFHNFDKIRNSINAYENIFQVAQKRNNYKNLL